MDGKKISFGFSKTKSKHPVFSKLPVKPIQTIEYISSFDKDENREVEVKEPDYIIPTLKNYTVAERILTKRKLDEISAVRNDLGDAESSASLKDEKLSNENTDISIEKLAIQELIDDAKKPLVSNTDSLQVVLVTEAVPELQPAEDSVDYECVPVEHFGLAMLKGMGWAPGKGIGKKQKVVEVKVPELRPRGMGLGSGSASSSIKHKSEDPKS